MLRLLILLILSIQISAAQDVYTIDYDSKLSFTLPLSASFNKPTTSYYNKYNYIIGLGCSWDRNYSYLNSKTNKMQRLGLKISYLLSVCRYECSYETTIEGFEVYASGMHIFSDLGFSLGPNFRLTPDKSKAPVFFYSKAGIGTSMKHTETRFDGFGSREDTNGYNLYGYYFDWTTGLDIQFKNTLLGVEYSYNLYQHKRFKHMDNFVIHLFAIKLGIKI